MCVYQQVKRKHRRNVYQCVCVHSIDQWQLLLIMKHPAHYIVSLCKLHISTNLVQQVTKHLVKNVKRHISKNTKTKKWWNIFNVLNLQLFCWVYTVDAHQLGEGIILSKHSLLCHISQPVRGVIK